MPRCFLLALPLVLVTVNLPAAPAPAPVRKGPSTEQIQQAIDDLSNGKFAVRERASKFLWEAGSFAEEALRAAAKSKDEETSNRAKAIVEKFDWGLYPDTPPEVVKLIEKFRGGDEGVRREAVGELIRLKPTRFSTLRKLIAQEQDENARASMYQTMAFQARQAVPALIVTNQLDEASDLLEICVATTNDKSLTDFAAFQHLRNKVPETIARMEAARKRATELDVRRFSEILAYLHRIQKNWPAARTAAEAAKNKELLNDIAWESNDWKLLAQLSSQNELRGDDTRGEEAAYQRLAGNKAEYDKLIGELRKDLAGVEGDDGKAFTLAHALLLNGQGADAIAVLKERPKHQPELVFDILCAQLKFKEAFALADRMVKELEKDEENSFRRDELDLQKAKVLAGLGDRDAATQVFRGVFDRSISGERFRIGSRTSLDAVKSVARSGMRDLAAECTARVLVQQEKQGSGDVIIGYLDPIFDDNKYAAQVWWAALRREAPNAEAGVTMARVLEFADGKADRKKVDKLVESIDKLLNRNTGIEKLDDTIFMIPNAQKDYAIAEAYRIAGVKDKAEEFYKKAVNTKMAELLLPGEDLPDEFYDDDSPAPMPQRFKYLMAYADFLLGQKRYKEAAELYRNAWELVPSQALPLFMTGFALLKSGNEREGTRLMGLAHWVPLGSDGARSRFSDELSERGFDVESRREMDLILTTSWFRTHYFGNTLLRAARIKSRAKDYATAAMYYEKDVISLFRTGAHFVEPKAYLTVPELSRTHRARALFAAGKIDEAMAEIREGLKALPGNVEVAIGFVPDLERAGKKKEADEVYQKVKEAFESALKDYGNSPDLRNSIAWTMVNCNRDLDDALKHAQKAVEQSPKTAGYIDTLAEIHFRKKDRAKALEFMKQCAALEPHNPYFRKQLERFEKKAFDSPLPDEQTGDD